MAFPFVFFFWLDFSALVVILRLVDVVVGIVNVVGVRSELLSLNMKQFSIFVPCLCLALFVTEFGTLTLYILSPNLTSHAVCLSSSSSTMAGNKFSVWISKRQREPSTPTDRPSKKPRGPPVRAKRTGGRADASLDEDLRTPGTRRRSPVKKTSRPSCDPDSSQGLLIDSTWEMNLEPLDQLPDFVFDPEPENVNGENKSKVLCTANLGSFPKY